MNDYHNPELQKMLESKITPEKYKQYAPILQEIMQRRAFEFDFSGDRTESETDNLVKNLNEIVYTNGQEITLPSNVAAVYNYNEKRITLNKEMISQDKEIMAKYSTLSPEDLDMWVGQEIFETLTHEVYHAITTWEDKKVGLEYQEYGMTLGRELTEAMTESAAARTSRIKNPQDMIKGYSRTSGYETTTFATNLLSYAMGTTQKELLANGIGNKEEFLEFLESKNPQTSREMLENELGLMESIFTVANKYPKGAITEDFTQEQKNANTKGFEHMFARISEMQKKSFLTDSRPLDMKVLGEMYARERKLTNSIVNSMKDLEKINFLDEEGIQKIAQGPANENMAMIQKMVLGSYVSYKRGFEPNSIEDRCARQGHLSSLNLYYNEEEISGLMGEFNGANYEQIEQSMLSEAQTKPEFFDYLQNVREDDFSLNAVWNREPYKSLSKDFEKQIQQSKTVEAKTPVSIDDDGR